MSRNLTSSLVDQLRSDIVEGRIAAGQKLPSENALIAEHSVSRTVVREAIMRLQAEGLVHTRKGSGSFALTPPSGMDAPIQSRPVRTLEDRRHLLAFRAGLESEAAALAATAHHPHHLAALREALASFAEADASPADAMARDFDFHQAVAGASGNPFFTDTLAGLGPAMISMPRHRLDAGGAHGLGAVAAEHEAVLAAIEAGDPVAAAAAMRTHLVNSRRRLDVESGQ
ncbi:FadR family transcriptional regulator [Arthrobacter livingstonensis]|uniref:FadR family transcriptional regulator n=1 Tax=Arthrobacter livingstonensis TaxID=670078 RepID=A0A2V5L690_9MICC|nr:FadR/GntR family transcriptional regulator [Arthrobacter livingstonensis]PYI66909.1 FadR family transcriptional regulator [Arthrobacter livingstonensis]